MKAQIFYTKEYHDPFREYCYFIFLTQENSHLPDLRADNVLM